MKILLINTPRSPHNSILENAPEEAKHFIHKKLIGPPLGLLTIAASVENNHDVIFFETKGEYDLIPETPPLKQLVRQLIRKHKPDVVGTTVITSEFYYGVEILETVKEENPEILTAIGGTHITLNLKDSYNSSIDVAFTGHSAYEFRDMIEAKERGLPLTSVAGIYLNNGSAFIKTKGVRKTYDYAGKDFLKINRNYLNRWKETYKVGGAPTPTTYIYTSLGCPYKCTFCSIWKEHDGIYFQRKIESIIEELKELDYDIVRFADANTTVNINFIDKLFDRIEEEGIKKIIIMDIRSDTAVKYPKLIEKMARNGLKIVICGFESYRDAELKKYNKNSSASYISKAIDVFHQNEIMLRGNYVIPNDYDLDDFKAMSEYANSHKVTYAGYTILTPMPGTDYHDEVKDQIIDYDLSKYNFFNCVLKTKLPLQDFYKNVGKLWLIKKGKDII